VSDLSNASPEGARLIRAADRGQRAARGAQRPAGLDVDIVAQQLKLAPRQVQALEDDDYARLPGRTFVRGFVPQLRAPVAARSRRYRVAAAGRGRSAVPRAADHHAVGTVRWASCRPRAGAAPSWARWAIPLAIVAIVVAAGVYEFRRPQGEPRRMTLDKAAPAPITSGSSTTDRAAQSAQRSEGAGAAGAAAAPAASSGPASAPAQPATGDRRRRRIPRPPRRVPAAADACRAAAEPAKDRRHTTSEARCSCSPLKGSSWVQVKRTAHGATVLSHRPVSPARRKAFSGAWPLDVVIGNAAQVTATFRGHAGRSRIEHARQRGAHFPQVTNLASSAATARCRRCAA
jgi:cytoskeleton protein RodZ